MQKKAALFWRKEGRGWMPGVEDLAGRVLEREKKTAGTHAWMRDV